MRPWRPVPIAELWLGRMMLVAIRATAMPAHAADPVKRWNGILVEDVPSFDPSGPTNPSAATVEELIFERLLTYDYLARPAKLVPMIAEAMPVVTDEGKAATVAAVEDRAASFTIDSL